MSKGSLREVMPETAWLIDELRRVFGRDEVDGMLRRAMAGEPDCFFAEENGHRFGTPFRPVDRSKCLRWSDRVGGLVSVERWEKEQQELKDGCQG